MTPSQRGSSREDVSKEVRETYLVILVLIAAAAYQTALSPPGGYWQEDKIASLEGNRAYEYASPPAANNFGTVKNHTAGTSIIGTNKNEVGYSLFVICNSLTFYLTIHMIFKLTYKFPQVGVMHLLLVLLSLNYTTCVVMVLPPDDHYKFLKFICLGMPALFLLPTAIFLFKKRSDLKYTFDF
ncbi:hypothetical protein LXL04_016734 [Taraxacum kok-saghyz]